MTIAELGENLKNATPAQGVALIAALPGQLAKDERSAGEPLKGSEAQFAADARSAARASDGTAFTAATQAMRGDIQAIDAEC